MPSAKKPAAKTTAVATRSAGAVSVKATIQSQIAKLAGKTEPATGTKIRVTQSKEFVLPDGTRTRDPIQVVILDFCSRNLFYPGAFDKDNPTPPACFAIGEEPKKLVPSENSPEPQCDTCAGCPNNAWDSNPNGKGGKACKNTRLLAVLPPDADDTTDIWLLEVSPTAVRVFDGYVNGLSTRLQSAPFQVVTTVGMDDSKDYPSLIFTDPELLSEDKQEVVAGRIEAAQKLLMAEPDVSGYGQEPTKKPAAKKAAPVKAAGRVAVARR